jgi:biofilm PGA synthesis N-glycosyltransferase PgaC
MKVLFLVSVGLIFFAYAGYPACLCLLARFRPRPVRRAGIFPRVTIVMAVHNEEKNLPRKLRNLAALQYPAELLELIIVSDGSTDMTNPILSAWQSSSREAVILTEHQGKANALNQGVAKAHGEIICFTDARQSLAPDGLNNLIANFADPSVGCASGALVMGDMNAAAITTGVGLYWQLEKWIRNWEGLAGSTVGATGAFYAVRKSLIMPLPVGTILDDVFIPLHVARQRSRVVFDSQAVAWDEFTPSPKQEFRRKVRTLAGNYQLLQIAPWLLTRLNPLRVQFACHKLARLLVPFALVGVLVSTLWFRTGVYGLALVFQAALYALAILTLLRPKIGFISRLANIALAFVVLNAAAFVAFIYFIVGRKAAWAR